METSDLIYRGTTDETAVLLVRANGGSVEVAASQKGRNDWVVTDTFSEDGGYPLNVGRLDLRIRPLSGAEFHLDRS